MKLMSIPVALSIFAIAATANAQAVQPRVAIQLLTSGLTSPLVAESENATLARLVLDTTGSTEAVRITSLPFILSTANGADADTLTNCHVVNEANASVALSDDTDADGLVAGLNTITLDNPLILNAGTVTTLSLRCDPSEDLVAGGTFTFSMNTANVSATGVTTGLPAIVTVRGAVVPPIIPPFIPGVPNTGAGGEVATNLALIFGSLTLAAVGVAYTKRATERAR